MPTADTIQRIYAHLGEATVLLPLQAGSKKCLQKAWQKVQLEETRVDKYLSKLVMGNIGASLGRPSHGLCSLDFDDDKVAADFLDANPDLQATFRTRGARGCNVWVRIDGDYPGAAKIFSRSSGAPVGEWRATGNYTAVWGRHPSGVEYTWLVDAPAKVIKYADIIWPDDLSVSEPQRTLERKPGVPLSETLLENRRKVAESMLEFVVWDDSSHGFCACPGKAKHTQADGLRDCAVHVDGVPTVHCLHTSCHEEVTRTNALLRTEAMRGEVVLIPDGHATVQDSAEALYTILKTAKRFYYRADSVCELVHGVLGPHLALMTPLRAMATWEKHTHFGVRSVNKDGESKTRLVALPKSAAELFLAADERHLLPRVDGVVTCPILYTDALGQLLIHNDGYNPHTRLYVANTRTEPVPNVPLAEAVEAIKDLVGDFDFEGLAHRSRAIMAFITPAMVFTGLLGGRPPVDVAEADESQAGKGYRHKMLCALYNESPNLIAQKNGGVGGFDESIQEALLRGRPFLQLDNLRGRLDSMYLEALTTAPSTIAVRGFGRAEVEVNVTRFNVLISSNDLQLTTDLSNRSSIIRIRKRPHGYQWKKYGPQQKDIASWIADNQPYYLGCVFAIVQAWHEQGCQTLPNAGHDFHWWAGRGEWIIQNLFGETPMLAGHRSTQDRAADPRLAWFQMLAAAAEALNWPRQPYKMCKLVNLCAEAGEEVYRKPGDEKRIFHDDLAELRYLGSVFGPLFSREGGIVTLDGYIVFRGETKVQRADGQGVYLVKTYTFERAGAVVDAKANASTPPGSEPIVSPANHNVPFKDNTLGWGRLLGQPPSVSFVDVGNDNAEPVPQV